MSKFITIILAILTLFIVFGLGVYTSIGSGEDDANEKLAALMTQYQQRVDLVPSLIDTLKDDFVDQEKIALSNVVDARSSVTSIQLSAQNLDDSAKFKQFSLAQIKLGEALRRLLVLVERYPQLKENKDFLGVRTKLDDIGNKTSAARKKYIESVKDYNLMVSRFPGKTIADFTGYQSKPNFPL
ncbi:MAG: LemA family protein [Cocleimonas sp.]